ncbi:MULTISPECIES: hypothetical protein [Nostocales]|uniref:Uncharacterized protein n=1 Tax=Dolichospermum flos-aquae UHCC 0037 TaxID=2590026 RepID=A0ACC7S6E5_DOLFA|nr:MULTISPECIES: hypothetical protein [Nostocales]ALB42964.1 hypothetical protein AA650_23125 [Anabaena sp. WA102]MBO1066228.1 hypothetical protein [Anabaena sp. 54]MTJ43764.1 hypothetical protein [Dolichospermum flos-aquae UHCC 0037]
MKNFHRDPNYIHYLAKQLAGSVLSQSASGCRKTPEFDVRKPAKNEYSKGLEAFLERAYILNKP